jgi:hypothetical protein
MFRRLIVLVGDTSDQFDPDIGRRHAVEVGRLKSGCPVHAALTDIDPF